MKKKLIKNIVFLLLIIFISFSLGLHYIVPLKPRSIHQWRQTDGPSIALNYYQHGMKFFEPEVHNQFSDTNTSGKVAGEFPGFYYFIALLWKVFGPYEWIYRLVDLILVFLGLFALFKTMEYVIKDYFWSASVAVLLFTSPIFVNYGISFITNVTAICFVLIAWFFFTKYYFIKKNRFLYLSMLFFAIAGLLKVSSLISFIFLFIILVSERIKLLKKRESVFNRTYKELIAFISVFGIVILWYLFARHFNSIHGGNYTNMDICPIWRMTVKEIVDSIIFIRHSTIYYIFSLPVLGLLFILFLIILIFPKKNNSFFYAGTLLIFAGSLMYALLWFWALNFHDYYYTDFLVFYVFIIVTFLIFLKNNYFTIFNSNITKIIFSLFLIYNIYYCRNILELRYFPSKKDDYAIVGSPTVIEQSRAMKLFNKKYLYAFETITPYLRSIGIQPDDKVISIPDPSVNITLYLMNQRGFTDSGICDPVANSIYYFVISGAKYFIINDERYLNSECIRPFLGDKVGKYKNISIFKVLK